MYFLLFNINVRNHLYVFFLSKKLVNLSMKFYIIPPTKLPEIHCFCNFYFPSPNLNINQSKNMTVNHVNVYVNLRVYCIMCRIYFLFGFASICQILQNHALVFHAGKSFPFLWSTTMNRENLQYFAHDILQLEVIKMPSRSSIFA